MENGIRECSRRARRQSRAAQSRLCVEEQFKGQAMRERMFIWVNFSLWLIVENNTCPSCHEVDNA